MKKRILFVIKTVQRGGGAEKVITSIADKLSLTHDVFLLTFRKNKDEYEYNNRVNRFNLGEEKATKNLFINFCKIFSRAKGVAKASKENNIDVVISFMKEANLPAVISKIFFKNKSKIYISVRNDISLEYSFIQRALSNILYPVSDKIIFLSEGSAQYFKNSPKISTIYNPVDIKKIQEMSRENIKNEAEANIFNSGRVLVNIGRLVPQKNHLLLIDVFHKLHSKYPDLKLVIIGDGPLRSVLEDKINKIGLKNRIFLLGVKANVYKYLVRGKIFVFTSAFEGLGNVILESMALGIPVVSNDCKSGPPEILGDTTKILSGDKFVLDKFGVRVPFNNMNEFVSAINYMLINNLEYLRYCKISKKRALDFDISKIVSDWNVIID